MSETPTAKKPRFQTNLLDRLDPERAMRPGAFDARVVLFLWCLRKLFVPMLLLGASVAFLGYGDPDAMSESLTAFDNPRDMLGAVLSPLGVLVAAIFLRITAGLLALAAAFPLTLSTGRHHYPESNRLTRMFRLWRDRLYQARAYRSLRLTWAVRHAAYQRLGASGDVFRIWEFVLIWANVILVIALFVVLSVTADTLSQTP